MAGEKSKGKCAQSKTSILIDAAPFFTILLVGNGSITGHPCAVEIFVKRTGKRIKPQ